MQGILDLVDFRNSTIRIINIIGPPGFGKSTLAIHVGHEVVQNGDTVHYINLADFPNTEVKLVLSEKILDSRGIVVKNATFDILLKWARERDHDILFIFDNCDDVIHSQMGEFQDALKRLVEESKHVKIILTSRKLIASLNYYEWFRVDELSDAAAYKLIESKVASKASLTREDIKEITKLTGNVPLALQIVSSLLRLPSSPSPNTVISELHANPMNVLTLSDFPMDEQMSTTITLSYKYLSKELQEISRILSVFPGSFTLEAARNVCALDNTAVVDALPKLVKNSLLEYNQQTGRYQYHRLIREYFLYIQKTNHSSEARRLRLSFQFYFSGMLMSVSHQFCEEYDGPLAFLDSELHNIQYLLRANDLSSLPMREFLVTTVALSKGVDVGLLTMRFSKTDLCTSLHASLNRLDKIIQNDYQKMRTTLHKLKLSLHNPPHNEQQHLCKLVDNINERAILSQYLSIIDRVSLCEEKTNGPLAAGRVYINHKEIVKNRSLDIDPVCYKKYFVTLSKYYSQQGNSDGLKECHKVISERTNSFLTTCKRQVHQQCNLYDVGVIYYDIEEYHKAAEILNGTLAMSQFKLNALDRMKVLVKLFETYVKLNESKNANKTWSELFDLQLVISSWANYEEIFNNSIAIQNTNRLIYDSLRLTVPQSPLDDILIRSVKALGKRGVHKLWCFSQLECKHQPSFAEAYNFVTLLYSAKMYSLTVDLGTNYINAFMRAPDYDRVVVRFQTIVAHAMQIAGNFSEGLDLMELVLNSILKHNLLYESEKKAAYYYLLPRWKYTYIISSLSAFLHPYRTFPLVLFYLFSPYIHPLSFLLDLICKFDNCSHETLNCFLLFLLSILHQYLILTEVIHGALYLLMWIVAVWIKLVWLLLWYRAYTSKESAMAIHLSVYYHFDYVQTFVKALIRSDYDVAMAIRTVRDPRFIYGDDRSPFVRAMDSGVEQYQASLKILFVHLYGIIFWPPLDMKLDQGLLVLLNVFRTIYHSPINFMLLSLFLAVVQCNIICCYRYCCK